jgi:hypothetical protein
MLKRLMYLPYYVKNTNRRKFYTFFNHVKEQKKMSGSSLYLDIMLSSLKYNISPMDYFLFRFFEKGEALRASYAGTGFMYEYQLRMNPTVHRSVLEDKIQFLEHFKDLSGRKWATLNMIKKDATLAKAILENPAGKVVVKNSKGQAGAEVKVLNTEGLDREGLMQKMKQGGYDLVESYVVQHKALMNLSSSGLNTLRLITQTVDKDVIIIAARMRVSVNSSVDNMAAGNFAAPVSLATGKICGPGVYSDITKEDVYEHPVSKVSIVDFQLPYWKECINLVEQAALRIPENRSIGWDVAITDAGPILIEGNHNWCKILWQLPVKEGLKSEILKYHV